MGTVTFTQFAHAVGITLFSDAAGTPKTLGRWGAADQPGVRAGVKDLSTAGSTNFQARAAWGGPRPHVSV